MRVLLTTPYDLAVPGGVNRQARDWLDVLTRRGVEARLAGPASRTGTDPDPRISHLGRVRVRAMNGAKSRVTLDLGLGRATRALLREFRPDVLHLHEPFLPTLNTFFLWQAGPAARVGTFHTYAETSRGYLWAWPWCRAINARLDARIAVSAAARDFATHYHPAEFVVVPNGMRRPAEAERRPLRPPGRPVRVLFVGRADEPRKGYPVLVEALRRLEAATPGAFVLEAVGPATPSGEVDAATLAAGQRAADICVVPSRGGESFGLVALEALAHGVPVIASRIRGHAEWLEGRGVGRLVAPGDPAALATALRDLAADPAEYLACAARAAALAADYDWDRVAEGVLAVYAAALAKRRRR